MLHLMMELNMSCHLEVVILSKIWGLRPPLKKEKENSKMQEPLMNHNKTIVQYIKKERKSRSGKQVLSREKIGVMVAAPDVRNPKKVLIGFSLKHRNDNFDYVDGKRVPRHGKSMAITRAERWANRGIEDVHVPDSIQDELKGFISRCAKYYKGTTLPEWAREIWPEWKDKLFNVWTEDKGVGPVS